MRALHWIGSSLEDIRLFPASVRIQAGTDLRLVQQGLPPRDWKPMTTVGRGVREIRIQSRDGAFRILFLVVTDSDVYVLHVFRKKSQKTAPADIAKGKARYRMAFGKT